VTQLDLRDFALAGFSMGGGEVARYIGKYGSKGVSKAVFISSVPPFLLKTPDNPEGVDGSVFAGIQKAVAADRYAFFTEFFKNFYNADLLLGKRVSEETVRASWTWRPAPRPRLVWLAWRHGTRTSARTWPVSTCPRWSCRGMPTGLYLSAPRDSGPPNWSRSRLVVVKDGPHCIAWTHAGSEPRAGELPRVGTGKGAGSGPRTGQSPERNNRRPAHLSGEIYVPAARSVSPVSREADRPRRHLAGHE